jgi:GT2 family glycosyltransferase/tetratricopeptide (TPR) repeat protein
MGLRYFFGPLPIDSPVVPHRDRQSGECLTFGAAPGADLVIAPEACWPTIEARVPAGWRPDFILLDLSNGPVPMWPQSTPFPVVGLAHGGDVVSGLARRSWEQCDRIVAGPIVHRVRSNGSPADWDDLRALIDREWPAIKARAASRRQAGATVEGPQSALENDPFDLDAARELFKELSASGEHRRSRHLAHDRRLLSQRAPELVPPESWFENAPPPDDERASIVILCCNQVQFTRACLESVLRWTRRPYELLLVDNGSTDETPAYLEEIRLRREPDRVEVIKNATNRGFPAGCNQAIERARGRIVVLLNNDTVVTEGWLDGLIAWSLHDWPNVGLVGAVSNAAAPPQQVEGDYDVASLAGLESFAARRRREFAGRAMRLDRLTGFCLLIRREVFDRVGKFDERFGPGFFDDDDLCVRAREAGFHLLLALDVFIHHAGSRTFAALGIDCRRQLDENFARFHEKWGPARSKGYRPPPEAPGHQAARPKVSLCMIVKNEQANLPECLGSACDLVDEIIVVDTGSTDRTREIATRFGARVFEFPWVDDFAAARNESIRHATGEWIFWLDADDRLDQVEQQKLRALFAELGDENSAYVMKCHCPSDPACGSGSDTVVDHIRLFRNDPALRWQYRVHEQIMPALRRRGTRVRWADVFIRHVGYQEPGIRSAKLERDIRLLSRSLAEEPDEPFVLFNMASVYAEQARFADALPLLKRSLERSHPTDSIVRKLYALIVQCHRRLEQPAAALESCRQGRAIYPEDAELLFQQALILRGSGDSSAAEACLFQLLQSREGDHFKSVDPGLRGYKARHNLAVLYQDQGRLAEANAQWLVVTNERPDFIPAWLGLAELYLAEGLWQDLEDVAQRLGETPECLDDAALFRARALLRQKEFTAARAALEEPIARNPRSVKPWVILTHILLQEGRDPRAAEAALRALLALDPAHAEAQHNLAVLLSKKN